MNAPLDPREAKIAALLAESYEMLGHLGRGGFATVYRVRNLRLNRVEALKVLSADLEEPDFADRFRQEARFAASLDHPRIVKIFDYGQVADLCWFTMQFVEGPTLIRELKSKGPWSEVETATLAAGIADALDYSHRRGIVHRDIKPENVLIDSDRRPFLMDFGIAKSDQSVVHTRTGTILGSPAYIAPEQLTGARVDGRADIYSLGATMYRMVSNSFPFQDSDPVRMAMKRFTMDPEPLGPKRPGIDPTFEAIVMRALSRTPEGRFGSAGEMSAALRNFIAGRPVERPSTSVPIASLPPEGAPTPRGISQARSQAPASGAPSGVDSIPTIRTDPPAPIAAERPPSRSSRGTRLGVAAVIVSAALATWLLRRPPASQPVPETPGVQGGRKAPVLMEATAVPRPDAVATAPLPVASAADPPAAAPTSVPAPASERGWRGAVDNPGLPSARLRPSVRPRASADPPSAPAAAPRRPSVQAQSETEAPIELSAAVAREYANRSVGLSVVVAEDGSVKEARVISPLCPECDRAARAAILQYRFKPARDRDGRPVESRVAVPVIIPPPD